LTGRITAKACQIVVEAGAADLLDVDLVGEPQGVELLGRHLA